MKFMTVPLPETGFGTVPTKPERKAKKILLKLHPCEYFAWSSNSKLPLRVRAVLQCLKPKFGYANGLMEQALKENRTGDRTFGQRYLHRIHQRLDAVKRLSLYDHLLLRYVRWTICTIKWAMHTLFALGLDPEDIRAAEPTLSVKRQGKRSTHGVSRKLFVIDEEYNNGV
jgi:hypothetical protein